MRIFLTFLILRFILPSADTQQPWSAQDKRADKVAITPYLTGNPNAPSVIVCPGGSYCWLDLYGEGVDVAMWLRERGVNAFVLQYRTAGFAAYLTHYRYVIRGNRTPDMLCDVQRAIRWVREKSDSLGIDPDRLGVMGFSAGGHLAMSAACYHSKDYTDLNEGPSAVSLRPDFVVPVYPVVTMEGQYVHKRSRRALLGEWGRFSSQKRSEWSIQDNIPADCPPVFLVNCKDDPVVDWQNSVILDKALTDAGVEHTYINYETGGHGFGVSDGDGENKNWKYEFLAWLEKLF